MGINIKAAKWLWKVYGHGRQIKDMLEVKTQVASSSTINE